MGNAYAEEKQKGTWRAIQCKKHRLSYMTRSAVKSPFAYSHSFTLDISQRAIFTTFALRSNLIRKLLTFSRCSRVLQRERCCYWGPCSPRYQSQHNARERPSLCVHHLHNPPMLFRGLRSFHAPAQIPHSIRRNTTCGI
jgi:hypothetical protein